MSTDLIDIEARWAANPAPFVDHATPTISAWTSNEEIAAQAAQLSATYGNRYDVDTELRLFRAQLRAAAMATAAQR
ncbi:hypothetical protein PP568_07100 [Mycobacteroides abscessus]|uniref:Uncharacterized protein n=1 Tax=Mycobacteroides abscessus subsp. abscessus TaxID=1185650 RepID=A0AB38D261_9MYCO|nr:hypothetical protein [Mycobacteroides abscessus]MBE5419622.1 hypothetical protein [Mycobacteroides abscessus]MBE5455678.1 hypothetical protein [Mycobacteroides abscessus]MBN7462942.1 hypothetical protein [Mycobacteroides abscessus subsp. abscessus]MBN7555304.1 hypothetical protein [Mycobacteroides abscessus subsp. abscessus]MDM2404699.1 hypothetical protein [Mycobacteroides abscessus]